MYAEVRGRIHEEYPSERRYTLHPASWFHQERYDDDPDAWGTLYDQPRAAPKTARTAEIERFNQAMDTAMDSIFGAKDDTRRIGPVHQGAQRFLPGGDRGPGPAGGGDGRPDGLPQRAAIAVLKTHKRLHDFFSVKTITEALTSEHALSRRQVEAGPVDPVAPAARTASTSNRSAARRPC
jgi:hypothetical protein